MRTFLILLILTTSISLIFFVSCQSTEKSAQNQGKNAEVEKVVSLTTAEKMENIKRDLVVVKAELAQAGEYNCCIQPACDWCAVHEGDC
ncbi:MAG: hypothetical protein ACE5HI_01630 [bacterium]